MKALILVDIQNDFMPTGALPVPEGDAIVPIVNTFIDKFPFVVATQDWHPANHGSFATQHPEHNTFEVIDLHGLDQVLWPEHCIQQSTGAEFHADLNQTSIDAVVQKGSDPKVDSYSGFADNGARIETPLHQLLQSKGITEVYICGLALDYCVQYTAHDALKRGYKTFLITDACRGIQPEGVAQALDSLQEKGAQLIDSTQL